VSGAAAPSRGSCRPRELGRFSGYNSGASGMLDRVVTYSLTPAQ
jgi:hypothetical protein